VLQRLRVEEGVAPRQITVLTGRSLAPSDVWRQRQFGYETLWDGKHDDTGMSLGLSIDESPVKPTDTHPVRLDLPVQRVGARGGRAGRARRGGAQAGERLMDVDTTRARQPLVVVRRRIETATIGS
jgi:hypothetical protein